MTDRFAVSREKLAFIVDATSAPITGLAVISTWIAYEVSLFNGIREQLHIDKSAYAMFFDALSFRFYCALMIVFVFVQIVMGRDFGPMKQAEERAKGKAPASDGNAVEVDHTPPAEYMAVGKASSALVPLFGLVIFHVTALWLAGGGLGRLETMSAGSLVYWRDTISAVPNSALLLLFSSSFGLSLACLFALLSEKLSVRHISAAIARGARKSMVPFGILILAWSVKNCCDELKTGSFLASILAGNVTGYLFPAMLFMTGVLVSFATGTSYGTMAILIPTAVPVAFAIDGNTYGITTMMSLGAVLDGAIVGDHCSPISDTTILSSSATQCELLAHVRTQLPYSIFVTILALACGYIPAAFGLAWVYSIGAAAAFIIAAFMILPRVRKGFGKSEPLQKREKEVLLPLEELE
jgi:Na+/H+ antiporter NhaC